MFYGGSTDYKIKNPIQYIFETGDEGYDEVQNALHEIQKHPELRAGITCKASLVRIKLPRFNSKRAGLWAYECYKHTATQYVANGKVTIRGSMKSLYRNYDAPYNTYFQEADVEPLFEMYKRSGGTWELQDAEWYQKRSLGSGR